MKRLSENPLLRHLAQFIGTIVVVAGFSWTIVKPHAEDFIKRTLKPDIAGLTESVESVQAVQGAQALDIREIKTSQIAVQEQNREQRDLSVKILLRLGGKP